MEATANVRREVKDSTVLLHLAIQQLREEDKKINKSEEEEEKDHLLSRLLSQLESIKDNNIDQSKPSTETKTPTSSGVLEDGAKDEKGCEGAETGMEEIVKELRIVRRQNTITHWLLSVMIVITAVWQVSEVSLLLYLKDTVTNPFKAIGGLITGSWGRSNESYATKSNSSSKQDQAEGYPLRHQIKMPELPNVDLSSFGLNGSS